MSSAPLLVQVIRHSGTVELARLLHEVSRELRARDVAAWSDVFNAAEKVRAHADRTARSVSQVLGRDPPSSAAAAEGRTPPDTDAPPG
jgi:hypothetical protein